MLREEAECNENGGEFVWVVEDFCEGNNCTEPYTWGYCREEEEKKEERKVMEKKMPKTDYRFKGVKVDISKRAALDDFLRKAPKDIAASANKKYAEYQNAKTMIAIQEKKVAAKQELVKETLRLAKKSVGKHESHYGADVAKGFGYGFIGASAFAAVVLAARKQQKTSPVEESLL